MAATRTRVERSAPAIRAVLAEWAPADCATFEAEFRRALTLAAERLDLSPVEAVLERWWGIAAIRANPLTSQERELVERARSGDLSGMFARSEDGSWARQ